MNYDQLNDLMREAGINICPICGVPFDKINKTQKTCGSDECKRGWKVRHERERKERMRQEAPEAYRAYCADVQRKTRQRKREVEVVARNLERVGDYWEDSAERADKDRPIDEDGIYYGRRQMEKTLATVPKIDVEGFRKEIETNDNLHDNDT